LGLNGSGKTSMLRIAVGELRADTGIVRFLAKPYERPRLAVLARRGLYYVDDRARLPSTFSVETHLRFISQRYGGKAIDEVVAALALDDSLDRRFHELGGGEGRRAAIAAAVIRAPKCLLVDEPFHGIAPMDEKLIAAALRQLAAQGTAIVTTGHEVEPLLNSADDVIWCVAGTTHGLGSPEDARSHPQFVREYLGWRSQNLEG
jgi:ABC-2 type transport system ATP-binding protein